MAASPLLRGAPTPHRTPLAPHSGVRSVLGQVPTSRTPQRPLVSGLLPLPSPQIPYTAAHLLPQCQTRSAMGAPPPPRQQPSHPPTDRIADSLDTLTALVSSFGQRLSALELQSTSHAASLPMPVLPSHVPYPHDPTPYTAAPLPAQTPVAPAAAPPGTCGPMPHHGPPSAATLPTTQHQIATELRHQLSHLGIDSSSDPEEDTRPKTRKSCRLKSGNVRATHDYVVKKMPWPHIGVFQPKPCCSHLQLPVPPGICIWVLGLPTENHGSVSPRPYATSLEGTHAGCHHIPMAKCAQLPCCCPGPLRTRQHYLGGQGDNTGTAAHLRPHHHWCPARSPKAACCAWHS